MVWEPPEKYSAAQEQVNHMANDLVERVVFKAGELGMDLFEALSIVCIATDVAKTCAQMTGFKLSEKGMVYLAQSQGLHVVKNLGGQTDEG